MSETKNKQFLKRKHKIFLALIIFIFGMFYPLPYIIVTVGDTEVLSDYIKIEDGYESEGDFSLVYVSVYQANIPTYFLTLFKEKHVEKGKLDKEEGALGNLYAVSAIENSKINILRLMGDNTYKIDYEQYVSYVSEDVNCDMRKADRIISYDGITLDDRDAYFKYIQAKELPNDVEFKLKTPDGYERVVTCKLINKGGRNIVGYAMIEINTIIEGSDLLDRIESDFSKFGGPSAGMMMTLEVYNQLIEEDLTSGYHISGTGTIELDGSIGQIGGIDLKVRAAYDDNADYFLVPDSDYEDSNYKVAMRYKEEHNLDIEIIKVNHIDDAINFLKGLKDEKAN